jgi:amino acid adenylation domain-containing protein
MQATPSTWRMLAAAGWQGSADLAALAGGEALPEPLAQWLTARSRALWNLYGPTETTVWSSVARIAPGERVSLGRPVANTSVRVLGARGEAAPVGGWGELHLGGLGLARGYLDRPALSAERFVPAPDSPRGERLYRTGDRARWLADGRLDFAGRFDFQVKVRGHRIELGEIESALAGHPAVGEAVVTVREDRPGDPRLVAYVVAREGEAPAEPEALRAHLAARLPAYMVPSAYVVLGRLPLTPNRKVDRRALPAPDGEAVGGAGYEAPASALERELAALWEEVLGVERVSRTAGFFALGGHSLLATELVARVAAVFGVSLPLRTVFQASTVAAMAEVVAELRAADPPAREPAPAGILPTLRPDPARRHEPFPLTEVQEAYWVGRSGAVELGSVSSHVYLELALPDLDLERLARAWRRLVQRHDMLRAVVLPDGRQRILPEVPPYQVRTLDLASAAPAKVEAGLAKVRGEMSHQVLPADRWPLFELRASLLPGGASRIHFSIDLLIADAWSFRLVGRELAASYRDPEAKLPPLELSFRDYVLAERALREGEAHERALAYWRRRLETLRPAPELPLAKDPASVAEPKFVRRTGRLEPARWTRIKERAARAALTPSGVLLAAFAEALATWSKSPRFTVNLTLFNRLPLHPQVNDVVGDFTSLTLLEVDRTEAAPFETCAQRLQERLWQDLDHRLVSGVRVLRELARTQGGARRAYMPVVFTSVLNQAEAEEPGAGREEGPEIAYSISQTPQVWLDHQVNERGGVLGYNWDAVEELFPEGLLDDLFSAYSRFLERLAEDEAAWTGGPPCLVPAAQLARQAAVNATEAPVPEGLLHSGFEERAAERPAAPAVIAGGRTVTYGELLRGSRRLGAHLRQAGARPNRLVAVMMEKGWEQVLAVLGILEAGAAYLPVDPDLPSERRHFLLASGEVELALVQPELADLEWPPGVIVVPVDEELLAAGEEVPELDPVQGPGDLAYVIFTSGSTGRPKGVMIDHRSALNTVLDVNSRFGVGPADRVLGVSSLSFDLSVWDVFGTLAAGATLVLPEPAARRDPARWAELIGGEAVSVWNSAPALMEMLAEYATGKAEVDLSFLRLALLSGDWIPLTLPDRIRALAPEARVVSLGGATEGSIWSIVRPVGEVDPGWASIPYGRPLANQTFHVLDHRLEPRPDWTPGELYIGGGGVARGYWRDPERTEAAFVTHPRTGERLYRTGDLGRYLPDGEIEFLGREDFQVQLQGHRVELGEIEAALLDHPWVRSAVVDAVGDPMGAKRLVAYVVLANGGGAAAEGGSVPAAAPEPHAAEHLSFKLSEPGLRRDAGRPALELPVDGAPEDQRETFLARRSHRRFASTAAPEAGVARLLGCLRQVRLDELPFPKYRYPSAGNLYPVQTYVHLRPGRVSGLAGGLYYHDPKRHRLVELAAGVDLGPEVHVPANRQLAAGAAFSLYLVAKRSAIAPVYGELARDFALLEAGAMSQLLMTEAPSAGLGLCPIGSVAFDAIRPLFDLDEDHELLHVLVGGVPAAEGVAAQEAPVRMGLSDATEDLHAFLERRLPAYMVPPAIVRLDALPLTANGKVDRKALPTPAQPAPEGPRREVPPASDLERTLVELWSELLSVESVGVRDNFFELGGTSVQLVRAYNRLQQHLGIEIPIVELFEHPTIHDLARHLAGHRAPGAVRDMASPTGEPAPEAPMGRDQERAEARRTTRSERRRRRLRAREDDGGDPDA